MESVYKSNRGLLLRFGVKWPAERLVQSDETGRFRRRTYKSSLCPCQYQHLVRTSAVMCLERGLLLLASSRWPGTTTTAGIYRVTLSTPPPLPRSSAELRFSSVGPRKRARSSLVRFILSSPYCAYHKSSPHRG